MTSRPTTQIIADCPACGSKADVTAHEPFTRVTCPSCEEPFRARDRFNHFLLLEQTGTGGMSRVFKALDTSLERNVALKILNRACSQDGNRVRQFEKEAEITAQVSHPNVVRVFTAGRDQGYFYIAMELVSGGSLEALLRERVKLPESRVLDIAVQAVQGLRAAHKSGLIHRDVKPGNILFAEDGTPKIVDFGLAIFAREADGSGEIWATPYYVPPETLNHEPEDFRSDIYSLGATLYHAMLGRPPCEKDQAPLAELREIKSRPIHLKPSTSRLSEETCAVLERCLAVKREARYRSYDELLDHLKYAQRRLRRGGKGRPWPGRRRSGPSPWQWAAAAAVLVAAGVGIKMSLRKPPAPQPLVSGGSLVTDADPVALTDTSTTARFNKARDAMLAADYRTARGLFDELGGNSGTPQPARNWSRFNSGLCSLFMGDNGTAAQSFAVIAGEGLYSSAPDDADLAAFFKNASAWLAADGLVSPERAADCPDSSVRAIGLLAAGLKNWNTGDAGAAAGFLQAFDSASPPGWVDNCKRLIRNHLADLATLKAIPAPATAEKLTAEECDAAASAARNLPQKLHLSGPVKDNAAKQVETYLAAVEKRKQSIAPTMSDADRTKLANAELKAIHDASAAAAPLGREFRFTEAESRVRAVNATLPETIAVRDAHAASWQNAHRFLEQLVRDLGTRGIEGVIGMDGGIPIRATVSANGATIVAQPAQKPPVNTAVGRISPVSLVELAADYRTRVQDTDDYFRRSELLYCFCLRTGLKTAATETAASLADEFPAFRKTLSTLNTAEYLSGP